MSDQERRKLSLKRGASTEQPAEAPRIEERLHKVLAQAGLGSRRALEQRIADGLVKVNGTVAQVGMSITGGDKIEIDGRTFVATALTEPARVLIYNKPEGEVTTREDPEGRPTIFESLPSLKGARWIAIGRLDINTTGLLLLTTDGELANAMMHPSYEIEREYVCRVRPPEGEEEVSDKLVDRLRRGVALEDGPAKFDEITKVSGGEDQSHDWYRVLLKEGRNREVRRLWESQGCQVSRLKRIRYGEVSLPQPLLRGQSQELAPDKVATLRGKLGLEDGTASLTLMPVIGQRKAAKSTLHFGGARTAGYVSGHNTADEGRELRRFDHVREDRRGGRGGKKPHGGLTVSGEAAANAGNKAFKPKGPRQQGQRMRPGEQRDAGNPAAFRTWYVPEGVDTGPTGHKNPDGARGPRKPYGPKPGGAGRPGGAGKPGGGGNKFGGPNANRGGGQPRPFGDRDGNRTGGPARPFGDRDGNRPARSGGGGARPYGHPGNAPSFPSDHANPGSFNPYSDKPRAPRPGGPRPGGPRPGNAGPGGPRPGGARPGGQRPGGPRPGGPRPGGPRGGGRPGGGRHSGG